MMRYIDVKWFHGDREDPIRLVSELDSLRNETRKLEFFRNGSVGFASALESSPGVELGTAPVPPLDEINASDEFEGVEISEADFEALWSKAIIR